MWGRFQIAISIWGRFQTGQHQKLGRARDIGEPNTSSIMCSSKDLERKQKGIFFNIKNKNKKNQLNGIN